MHENDITRREAVERLGALGAAGALMTTPDFRGIKDDLVEKSTMIDQNKNVVAMTKADWTKLIGDTFEVTGLSFAKAKKIKKTRIKLVDVDEHKHETDELRPAGIRQSGCSLVFEAPLGSDFDNRTHSIEHQKLGTLHFHIQRIQFGKDHVELKQNKTKKQYYEVVIN